MSGVFEDERRRDDWIKGRYVRLEDGTEWSIPLPRIEYRLSLSDRDSLTPVEQTTESNRKFGDRFFKLQGKFIEFVNSGDRHTTFDMAHAILPIAIDLIQRNYKVTEDEILSLLTFTPGDDNNEEMFVTLANIALGVGPKQ